jgi:hypothetical protein
VHVGVLSAVIGTAGQTLAVRVWYSYQPGGLVTVLTGRRSRKAVTIRAAGRFGVCAQDDSPPYRYVSVEGPVVREEELDRAERLAMARRYLGAAGGDRTSPTTPTPNEKTWRSECARSTGSARIRASDKPNGRAAPWHHPMYRHRAYAPLPARGQRRA